jgi:sec-independent protein translocase protein TatB
MPQIGWFEILVVVVLAILIIGPKDFPIVIRKIGNWTGSVKRYFSEIQEDVTDLQETIEDEISIEEKYSKNKTKDKQEDE